MQVDDRPLVSAFYVDVNAASESGQVPTTPDSTVDGLSVDDAAVKVGMYVLAVDADDNACVALVTDRGDGWLMLHMDESTWKPLSDYGTATVSDRAPGNGAAFEAFVKRLVAVPKSEIDAERKRERRYPSA